jgi:AcrR family transcriptional regulator
MHAAAELMLETGFDGMTTAAVARRAGVAEGTIYRHFPSKEALAEAVFAEFWGAFNAFMHGHLPPRERPIERFEAFFPIALEALAALIPRFGVLMQQEHLYYASKHGHKCVLPAGAEEFVVLLEETILRAQQAGRVRPEVDPRIAAHFIFFGAGQLMDFFGNLHVPGGPSDILPPDVARQLRDLMVRALAGDAR